MIPAARIQASIDMLGQIYDAPKPADATVSAFLRERRYIGSKDRAALLDHTYAALRRHARLAWWCEQLDVHPTARTLMLLNLCLGERRNPAEIKTWFSGEKFCPAPLKPWEREMLDRVHRFPLTPEEMPPSFRVECPPWAEDLFEQQFGDAMLAELAAMIEPATTDLRVNTLRAPSREAAQARLAEEGIETEVTALSPWGLRLLGRANLQATASYREGWVEIQDEGSQMVAWLAGAKPGERVLDFCAGAGGKTLALGQMMANKGRLMACDVLEGRLKRARERFTRAGVDTIQIRALSSEADPWVKRHKGGWDRVLVDAPCSGVGTWRRNPDARWRRLGPDLDELLVVQQQILQSASRLVRPGGRLIYATCSLFSWENDDQVAQFLDAEEGAFRLIPAPEALAETSLPEEARSQMGTTDLLYLTPLRHGTDGFFGAVMERVR